MKIKLFALLTLSFFLFQACSDDDDNVKLEDVSVETKNAQQEKFPEIPLNNVKWEREGSYMKAEFMQDGREVEVWYDNKGAWFMTETDYGKNITALPVAVQNGFKETEYGTTGSGWIIDDIDKIERDSSKVDIAVMYIIELEKGEAEVKIHLSEDGKLIGEYIDQPSTGGNSGLIPSERPASIDTYVKDNFPGARIKEVDVEGNGAYLEVEIIHEGREKDIYFKNDTTAQWLWSEWEITYTEVPEVVKNAITASEYASWQIDDIEYVNDAMLGVYYRVEFEKKGQADVKINFNEGGTILVQK